MEVRTARPVPGSLASRQDGPWREGIPFRGAYWLRRLGNQPAIGMSVATLTTSAPAAAAMKVSPALLQATLTRPSAGAPAAAARHMTHAYVPGELGPHLVLPAGQTDRQLREAVAPYSHVSLLQVSLSDASAVLRCYEASSEATEVRRLVDFAFRAEWCYRPAEMTEEWTRVQLQGKPKRGAEPWCHPANVLSPGRGGACPRRAAWAPLFPLRAPPPRARCVDRAREEPGPGLPVNARSPAARGQRWVDSGGAPHTPRREAARLSTSGTWTRCVSVSFLSNRTVLLLHPWRGSPGFDRA
eukprot:scaffold2635_cov106-Isochrysis_galbana.AAC.2